MRLVRLLPARRYPAAPVVLLALASAAALSGPVYGVGARPVRAQQAPQRYSLDADGGRRVFKVDAGWRYLEHGDRDVAALDRYAASEWRTVELPHTWNAFDTTDPVPGYRRDASWYRREIAVGDTAGARYVLHFEATNMTSDVYVNGRRAGGHVGGYVGYDVDLTPYLRPNAGNRVDVRVDNRYDPDVIPSQKADYFITGGIPRDAWLRVVPATRVRDLQIRTPRVSRASGEAVVGVDLAGPAGAPSDYVIDARLLSPDGRVVARRRARVRYAGGDTLVELNMPAVRRPDLWSPSSPKLYRAVVRLTRDGQRVDELGDRFGFRWFEFRPGGPFYLNGERLLLRGTHWHEDYAGYGEAMPDSLRIRDMRMIKAMGANYVRLAHYPHDPSVYATTDSIGLLVWDELPWNRGGVGGAKWKANSERLLAEQIHQNLNHPSIILWSLGNEVDWLPDRAGGGDPDSVDAFIRVLDAEAHRLDPGRMTAMRKYPGAARIVDVFSPSIWAGWYSGVYRDYAEALASAHEKYPRFVHMEYGGSSLEGRHTEHPIDGKGLVKEGEWEEKPNQVEVKNIAQNGDWSENYVVDLMEWHILVANRTPWLTGNAQWAFKDFPTPLRPENAIPYMNTKGVVDRAGHPKDAYYVYKAHWTTNPKFTYILSHTWTDRSGPPGTGREVRVYSNCDAVELLLNGRAQGTKQRVEDDFPAQGLRWVVHFAEGDNHLAARCLPENPPAAADSMTVHYGTTQAGGPEEIVLSTEPLPDGHLLVIATMVDAKGRRVLDYNRRVYFSHDGAGHLVADRGTPTGSRVIEFANGRAAIEFAPDPAGGRAVIEASNQDFKGTYLVLP
ncbi:MAG TPA: glycoside hydrolase family 2 TIM barrel-domain containing protein [Longimicrobiaceae bacterium]|nr:glycoside hydrolase family 2 TIM barrel-domain containing protein [Longimicrobiaceae bacterium]